MKLLVAGGTNNRDSGVATSQELMYPWRSSDILKRYVLMKKILFGERIPSVLKTLGRGYNHFSLLISSSKTFGNFKTHPPSRCLIAYDDVDDVLMLNMLISEGVYQSPSIVIFVPFRETLFSNCLDMYVLLQYDIVSICHFGSVLVRSHPGAMGVEWKILLVSCPIYHCNKICMFTPWYAFS